MKSGNPNENVEIFYECQCQLGIDERIYCGKIMKSFLKVDHSFPHISM
jgi:hypothetical protein